MKGSKNISRKLTLLKGVVMKIFKFVLPALLLISSIALSEIRSVTICDHNKGEYGLIGFDKRKISNGCINCSVSGLGSKCNFLESHIREDQKTRTVYRSNVILGSEGYPFLDLGSIVYDI